jgi:hypothetical protein
MWFCLVLREVFCFCASLTHMMYMGDRFSLFEFLIVGLYDNLFSLSFREKKGESFGFIFGH